MRPVTVELNGAKVIHDIEPRELLPISCVTGAG